MASKEVAHLSCSSLATATKLTLFSRGNSYNPQKLPLYLSSRLLSHTSENSRCYQKSNLLLSTLTLLIKLIFTNEPLIFCSNSIPRENVQYPHSLQVFEHPPQLCLTSFFVLFFFLSKVQLYCLKIPAKFIIRLRKFQGKPRALLNFTDFYFSLFSFTPPKTTHLFFCGFPVNATEVI